MDCRDIERVREGDDGGDGGGDGDDDDDDVGSPIIRDSRINKEL